MKDSGADEEKKKKSIDARVSLRAGKIPFLLDDCVSWL